MKKASLFFFLKLCMAIKTSTEVYANVSLTKKKPFYLEMNDKTCFFLSLQFVAPFAVMIKYSEINVCCFLRKPDFRNKKDG